MFLINGALWGVLSEVEAVEFLIDLEIAGAETSETKMAMKDGQQVPILDILSHDEIYLLGMWALVVRRVRLLGLLLRMPCAILKEKAASYFFYHGHENLSRKLVPEPLFSTRGWLWEEMYYEPRFDIHQLYADLHMQKLMTFLDK